MAHLLLLTNALAPSAEVLPALGLLSHQVRVIPAEPTALVDAPHADIVLVDARRGSRSPGRCAACCARPACPSRSWPSSRRAGSRA